MVHAADELQRDEVVSRVGRARRMREVTVELRDLRAELNAASPARSEEIRSQAALAAEAKALKGQRALEVVPGATRQTEEPRSTP